MIVLSGTSHFLTQRPAYQKPKPGFVSYVTNHIDVKRTTARSWIRAPVRPWPIAAFRANSEHPSSTRSIAVHKAIAIVVLAAGLAACGVVSTLMDGFKYAKAVEADLEEVTGMKPGVGFNWNNGRLVSVTVTFPRLYEAKPLGELAEAARAAVTKEFKQTPQNIVLAFALGAGTPGRTAQAGQAQIRAAD
jgi:hypothetical protein